MNIEKDKRKSKPKRLAHSFISFENIFHRRPFFIKTLNNFLWGCSCGNSFPVVFSLNQENDIISSRSYMKYFPPG